MEKVVTFIEPIKGVSKAVVYYPRPTFVEWLELIKNMEKL